MTLAELNYCNDLIANTAKTILLADSPVAFPYPVYTHRELIQQNNQCRVEITCTGGERASDHMDLANIAGVQTPFYNHQRFSLAFDVITAVADRGPNSNHAYVLGRIGTLCRRDQQKFSTTALSGLVVLDLDDRGPTPTENEQTDTDRDRRTYDIETIIPAALYAAAT